MCNVRDEWTFNESYTESEKTLCHTLVEVRYETFLNRSNWMIAKLVGLQHILVASTDKLQKSWISPGL